MAQMRRKITGITCTRVRPPQRREFVVDFVVDGNGRVSGAPIGGWAPAVLDVFEYRPVRMAGYKPSAIRRS